MRAAKFDRSPADWHDPGGGHERSIELSLVMSDHVPARPSPVLRETRYLGAFAG